jgi:hypothetical protein
VGEYEMMPGQALTVSLEGEKLLAQMTGQNKLELLAESETKFFVADSPAELEFFKNDKGVWTSLKLRQGEFEFTLKKVK